jgi:hypothetical protein
VNTTMFLLFKSYKTKPKENTYMSVDVMKDKEVKLRDVHVSYTLGHSERGTGTPKDRDKVKM